eukprot:6490546-Amphidinium_carterae.2
MKYMKGYNGGLWAGQKPKNPENGAGNARGHGMKVSRFEWRMVRSMLATPAWRKVSVESRNSPKPEPPTLCVEDMLH